MLRDYKCLLIYSLEARAEGRTEDEEKILATLDTFWNSVMTEEDRKHAKVFAAEIAAEYLDQDGKVVKQLPAVDTIL